jgi:hypothetical protein
VGSLHTVYHRSLRLVVWGTCVSQTGWLRSQRSQLSAVRRAVTLVILVSQPAKNINSIAPYTYVTSLRPMHMAPPIKKTFAIISCNSCFFRFSLMSPSFRYPACAPLSSPSTPSNPLQDPTAARHRLHCPSSRYGRCGSPPPLAPHGATVNADPHPPRCTPLVFRHRVCRYRIATPQECAGGGGTRCRQPHRRWLLSSRLSPLRQESIGHRDNAGFHPLRRAPLVV